MTRQELIEKGFEDVIVFENPDYDGCILGISIDNRAIYSLEKMVAWYCKNNGCSFEEALEFIEYNTIRALPYQQNAPIILNDLCEVENEKA